MYELTSEQIENVVIGTGVVYYKYQGQSEKLLAPTRGGNSFVVQREFKNIERDGARGKEKGLRWIIEENATLTVNLMDMSQDNLKLALPGAVKDGVTDEIEPGDSGKIPSTDYLEYVKLVGETLKGDVKVITLYDSLGDNGLEMNTVDRDESVVAIEFAAHWDPTDTTKKPYSIEQASAEDTYTVTFEVETSLGAEVEDAIIYFDGKAKLTNSDGVAIFYSMPDGAHEYTAAKGSDAVTDDATVAGADLTEPVTLG